MPRHRSASAKKSFICATSNLKEVSSVRIQKRVAVTLSGLFFAGGTALAAGPALAVTSTSHGNTTVAPHNAASSELSTRNLGSHPRPRPGTKRCHIVRGHWLSIFVLGHG